MPSLFMKLLLPGLTIIVLLTAFLWSPPSIPFSAANVEAFHVETYLRNGSIRSWEEGVWTQALIEIHNPELTVYASEPFPSGQIPSVPNDMLDTVPGLASAAAYIDTGGALLCDGGGTRDILRSPNLSRH
jgi:hypothetical protein